MSRINTTVKNRFDGKRFYASPNLPIIPVSDSDIFITSNSETRLDILALEYYGNSSYWWVIAKANNIGFGYYVPFGEQIRIPAHIEKYL